VATLSQYEAACIAEPSATRFSVARVCFAIRQRATDGYAYTTGARDVVLGQTQYATELEQARINGWDQRNPSLLLSGLATTTGL
jgi:hypothetical protein